MLHRRLLVVVLVAIAALGAAACGDDTPAEPIEFGEGSVPATMPDSIPIPQGAAIGSTLVDRINNRTEMSVQARLDYEGLVRFYGIELVNEGFILTESSGDEFQWTIKFVDGDLIGDVLIAPAGSGLSRAVIGVNRS